MLKWLTSERASANPATMVSVSNGRPVWAVPGTPELTRAAMEATAQEVADAKEV